MQKKNSVLTVFIIYRFYCININNWLYLCGKNIKLLTYHSKYILFYLFRYYNFFFLRTPSNLLYTYPSLRNADLRFQTFPSFFLIVFTEHSQLKTPVTFEYIIQKSNVWKHPVVKFKISRIFNLNLTLFIGA